MPQVDIPLLDLDGTMERLKGDKDFLFTLFQVFLDDLPNKLSTLSEAFETKDMELIMRTAHSLKGASATIGSPAVNEAALAVETAARNNNIDAAAHAYPALVQISGDLQAQLQETLAQG